MIGKEPAAKGALAYRVAVPEELRFIGKVDEPRWKITSPVGVPEVPTAETLAVSVYSEPAVNEPAGVIDRTVAEAGMMVSSGMYPKLPANRLGP